MHDMGNSMGGLGSYMKLIDKYDMYQGGFIWNFIDQAILVKDPVTGKEKPAMQKVRYYYGLYR